MAVDPNTGTPQGPAGWGLNPLGTPSVSTTPLAPRAVAQFTPDQIAQMRKEAMALQAPQQEPIHHWTQGLAELVRAIQGNREADFARQQEATGRTQGAQAISDIYKPYLSPGGQPPPSATGAAPAGVRGDAAPAGGTVTAGNDPRGMVPYIRETAAKYGVDPDTAVKVAGSEGLREFSGDGGKSGGAFQLYTGGGMGNDFQKETGLDPLDPKNEKATIDYALKNVPKVGWTPFHGARKVGIGQWDGITQANAGGAPAAAAPTATGLLAPPPTATPPAATPPTTAAAPPPVPANQASAAPATPTRLAYAGDTIPPGMLPTQGGAGQSPAQRTVFDTGAPPVAQSPMSPLVNAIAGRPMPNGNTPPAPPPAAPSSVDVPDFAKQAAILAAQSDRGPSVPLSPDQARALTPQPASPPNPNFAAQVAALSGAADRGPSVPLAPGQANLPGFPPPPPGATASPPPPTAVPQPPTAAPPPSPVPVPTPRPAVPLPTGSAVPGAVGPTSVGGAPLVPPAPPRLRPPVGPTSVNGQQLPQGGGMAPQNAAMLGAIAGQPAAGGGAPNGGAPIRVAQNGMPTAAIPTAATAPAAPSAGPSGLPQPLTAPTGQVTQDQLTRVLANPWVPESAKASMLQMIQQRGQPQTMPVEGGTLMYDAAGHKVFIPEPKFGTVKIGSAEVPTVSHFDPSTGRWNTTTLAPGGGVQTTPGAGGAPTAHPGLPQQGGATTTEPDLSTIGGIQANEAAQAGAKKAAEAGGEASAKYYDSLHKGLAGSAMIAAQQKQNIDLLRQVASSPDFTPGAGSEAALGIQRLASSLGINPTGAAPRELFNQVATRILADQISGIKSMSSETGETGGRIFKTMLDLEEKANITPQDSGPGINAKLDLIDNAGNLMMKWGDLADDYVAKHGKLDAGFDKELRSEIAKARIPNAVPQASQTAPTAVPSAASDYLKSHPELRDQFDAKYGAGSAATVLGK